MTKSKRIVIINDDPTQLKLVGRLLEQLGYEIDTYLDSAEALADLSTRTDVDLFIIDLHMPGIDGWKLCRLLRSPDFARFNETPVLVVSATFTGVDVEAITADLGANAFLPLPFTREDLLEYTADLLAGNRPRVRSKVLLVEDDERAARAVSRAFDENGFRVRAVSTAADARAAWDEEKADVVLLDYHLPDSTCEDLVEQFANPSDRSVVIVMTGDMNPTLPVSLLGRGADAYVRKPFDPAFVVELARKAQRERALLRVEAILEQRTQELKASERRYRALFDGIPDLVVVLDDADRILHVNEEVAKSVGRSASSLETLHFLELVPPDAALKASQALDQIRRKGSGRFETTFLAPTGPAALEFTGMATEDEGHFAILLVGRDLTWRREAEEERRRLQEQMQHAQRLESLGVLAGGIAHDFNNLLVGILGNASLALLETDDGSSVQESIHQIETAAKRAAELTQQILTFSGKGKAVMKALDLSDLVSEMGQLLEPAVSKKAHLRYRLLRTLDLVEGDASQIRQVVMNLIMNASDALGGQPGTITVETREELVDAGALRSFYLGDLAEPGRYASLEVVDDGCGMDAGTLQQIFDPFFSTKFTGRGLGLAATLGIVRTHRGMIAVESAPGRGTRFRVLFPMLAGEKGRGSDESDESAAPWAHGGTVLVVDDERAVRHLARAALIRNGFDVIVANDGVEGLTRLDDSPQVIAVLLDLTMPELDGLQVLASIREMHPTLPVLLSSGYTAESIPAETLDRHTSFLRKPYMPGELIESLSQLLRTLRIERSRTNEAS